MYNSHEEAISAMEEIAERVHNTSDEMLKCILEKLLTEKSQQYKGKRLRFQLSFSFKGKERLQLTIPLWWLDVAMGWLGIKKVANLGN